jgi:hypothetical protein
VEILARIDGLRHINNSDPGSDGETRRKLNEHGIDDDEIARQLATLRSNTAGGAGVLINYSLLHSLQHLDAILARSPRLPHAAEAVVTIFRCAEVALGCLAELAERMAGNLERQNADRFVANARWRAALHELLYRLSALVVEVAPGAGAHGDAWLDVRLSATWTRYEAQTARLQQGLMTRWPEPATDIFGAGLDQPSRFMFFNEFVNTSDERIWLSRLSRVRLAGVSTHEGEDDAGFYERIVGAQVIAAMLAALETHEETDLLPFRVVHQVSEIIANTVHQHLSDVIESVLGAGMPLADAVRVFEVANRLLSGVDDSIKMMLRALTPAAYSAVRPNLGMVQGTSSVVLRKVLFNTIYPMLVRACRLRLCRLAPESADDDVVVEAEARERLGGRDEVQRQEAAILRSLVVLYQHVRTWRDNHLQLPKTHLGISPPQAPPTVSLSGSDSAVGIAHHLRRVHGADPIAPLYRATLGTEPPPVHPMMAEGGFDQYMANQTATAVFDVYDVVQKRFDERKHRLAEKPAGRG